MISWIFTMAENKMGQDLPMPINIHHKIQCLLWVESLMNLKGEFKFSFVRCIKIICVISNIWEIYMHELVDDQRGWVQCCQYLLEIYWRLISLRHHGRVVNLGYSPLGFDERVTFWIQRVRSLPCACAYVVFFAREASV